MSVVRIYKGKMTEAEKFEKGHGAGARRAHQRDCPRFHRGHSGLGPALLPAGGLIIEGVHDSKESVQSASNVGEESDSRRGSDGSFVLY